MTSRAFCLCFILTTLCSCAPYKFGDHHAGECNELNSQIIFSGSTSNVRTAEIQHSEEPLMRHSYDKKCAQ